MKLYFKLVLWFVVGLGLITTSQILISQPSNIELTIGILISVLSLPIIYYMGKWISKDALIEGVLRKNKDSE